MRQLNGLSCPWRLVFYQCLLCAYRKMTHNSPGLTPHLLFAILGDHKLKFLSAVELNLYHYCCCCYSTIFNYLKGFAMSSTYLPSVSVIVPVHNGGGNFRRCLESLAAAEPAPKEIIVVAGRPTQMRPPSGAPAGPSAVISFWT